MCLLVRLCNPKHICTSIFPRKGKSGWVTENSKNNKLDLFLYKAKIHLFFSSLFAWLVQVSGTYPEFGALWLWPILVATQGGVEWAKRADWKILLSLLHDLLTTGNLPRLIWSLKPGFMRPDIFYPSMYRNIKPPCLVTMALNR